MSVDIQIGDWSGNYTHNTSRLWHDHLHDGDLTGFMALDGKTGKQALLLLRDAFDRIQHTQQSLHEDGAIGEPHFCARYDAKNGWGSAVGALIFMAAAMGACGARPRSIVRVSV